MMKNHLKVRQVGDYSGKAPTLSKKIDRVQ